MQGLIWSADVPATFFFHSFDLDTLYRAIFNSMAVLSHLYLAELTINLCILSFIVQIPNVT